MEPVLAPRIPPPPFSPLVESDQFLSTDVAKDKFSTPSTGSFPFSVPKWIHPLLEVFVFFFLVPTRLRVLSPQRLLRPSRRVAQAWEEERQQMAACLRAALEQLPPLGDEGGRNRREASRGWVVGGWMGGWVGGWFRAVGGPPVCFS